MKTIVIASGYFNPLHKGHVEYLYQAWQKGFFLYVIVNNDKQVALKGSQPFMDMEERIKIVQALKYPNYVVPSIDEDASVSKTIAKIYEAVKYAYYNEELQVIFAKGGDRNSKNIPEAKVCKELGIKIIDGLGKKIQSSSELLRKNSSEKLNIRYGKK